MVKIKVRFPESKKKQRKIADEVRNTAYECAEELWEAICINPPVASKANHPFDSSRQEGLSQLNMR